MRIIRHNEKREVPLSALKPGEVFRLPGNPFTFMKTETIRGVCNTVNIANGRPTFYADSTFVLRVTGAFIEGAADDDT